MTLLLDLRDKCELCAQKADKLATDRETKKKVCQACIMSWVDDQIQALIQKRFQLPGNE